MSVGRVLHRVATLAAVLAAGRGLAEDPPLDPAPSFFGSPVDKTRLAARETEELPTARNLWALLENQVPGVVTDRVDVGGLRGDSPARFGGLGSSWTQNTVLLNGLDLTDRYGGERPALFADLNAFEAVDVSTALHPASVDRPGVAIALVPRRGGETFHAGVQLFAEGDRTQSDNVTAAKRTLGVTSPERLGSFGSGSVDVGGPLAGGRVRYFLAASRTSFSKSPENVSDSASSSLNNVLLNLTADLGAHRAQLLWAGDELSNPRAGLSALVPVSATQVERERFHALQLTDAFDPAPGLTLTSEAGIVVASLDRRLQDGVQQSGVELFQGLRTGAAPLATRAARRVVTLAEKVEGQVGETRWQAGVSWDELFSTTSWRALDGVELEFFGGQPFGAVLWNNPAESRQRERNIAVFVQGRATFAGLLRIDAGLRLRSTRGWLPDEASPAISWTTLSPRVQVSLPVGRHLVLRAGYSRYFHQLLANLLDFEDPRAPGGRVARWNDKNGDGQFQPGEEGQVLRLFGGNHSRVDPDLKPPYTDELMVGLSLSGRFLELELTALQRYDKRLIGLLNTGVPDASYTPVTIHDDGGDGQPGTPDDQDLVVYNQKPETLGRDSFLLTNPPGFRSFYQGVEIAIRLTNRNPRLYGRFSVSACRIVGMASQSGDSQEYDPGVVGNLYADPNTLINADGRLFFDRAFVAKLAAGYRLPWGVSLGAVAKYWDGLPFGRKLIVTGMNQGPFYVLATQRGNGYGTPNGHRTQYNATLDLSLEKRLPLAGQALGVRLDVFNALNTNQNTLENDLSGPNFQSRPPLEIQAPRVFRLGMTYVF